jgi:hypothetical protein
VLLDGHELYGVVAGLDDTGQDGGRKFAPGADRFGLLGHAGVGLVDHGRAVRPLEFRMSPAVRVGWRPYLGIENQGVRILYHPSGIGRQAVALAAGPMNAKPIQVSVREQRMRQTDLPLSVIG